MNVWILILAAGWLAYLALEMALYWIPLYGAHRPSAAAPAPALQEAPSFIIVAACRDGADCVPGFAQTWRAQDYPASRLRTCLIADHCRDDSAPRALAEGLTVYERRQAQPPGKGPALSEWVGQWLRHQTFDALIVLDIDGRVRPDFLNRAARRLRDGAEVFSCATAAKNPGDSLLAWVGALIQRLLRLHQQGRSACGLDAMFHGSHGYVLSRRALERLQWRTHTGLIAEDMEARLRCTLAGLSVRYADDLVVTNDVTAEAAAVREQRRRWNSTYWPLIPAYGGRLLGRILRGDGKAFDALFGLMLLPGFANLFLLLAITTAALSAAGLHHPPWRPYAMTSGLLWALDGLYFAQAFRLLHVHIGLREARGLLVHLGLRALALAETIFYVRVKDWMPAPHEPRP